jgi:hypothetical protein
MHGREFDLLSERSMTTSVMASIPASVFAGSSFIRLL